MQRKVWFNGNIIDEKDAKVSIYDEALMFGTLCFEMMRTFNKKTFKLQEHLDRLAMSCKVLETPLENIDYDLKEYGFIHEELLDWHIKTFPEVEEWRTLINVSRGILPLYQDMLGEKGTNIMIACFPLKYILKGKSSLYAKGVHAIVPSQRAIPHYLLDARLKTRSRQHYQIANLEVARQDPEAWPLLLDEQGFISESTGANFFIIERDGDIVTPDGRNCLRGISRQFILDNNVAFPSDITLYDVYNADEAFFTCTPYSIVPVTRINGKQIGNGKVGEITSQITEKWIDYVQCDFVEQARRWDNVPIS